MNGLALYAGMATVTKGGLDSPFFQNSPPFLVSVALPSEILKNVRGK